MLKDIFTMKNFVITAAGTSIMYFFPSESEIFPISHIDPYEMTDPNSPSYSTVIGNHIVVTHYKGSWVIDILSIVNSDVTLQQIDGAFDTIKEQIASYVNPLKITDMTIIHKQELQYNTQITIDADYNSITSDQKEHVENIINNELAHHTSSSSIEQNDDIYPIGYICFLGNTPIQTDQGLIPISKISPKKNTIYGKKIENITKTITHDTDLVKIMAGALGKEIPSRDLIISKEHKVQYDGSLVKARSIIGKNKKVVAIPYKGEILYNILMDKYAMIKVNNLVCETLHPDNMIAKFYKTIANMTEEEKKKVLMQFNNSVRR